VPTSLLMGWLAGPMIRAGTTPVKPGRERASRDQAFVLQEAGKLTAGSLENA
jgi:hypothetical protein